MNQQADQPNIARRRAFTLIEILVVVAIIAVLLGIGIAIGPSVMGKAEELSTRSAMQAGMAGVEAYRSKVGSLPNIDFDGGDNTEKLIDKLKKVPSIRDGILAGLNEDLLNADGALIDGWGNEMLYLPSNPYDWNEDGNDETRNDVPEFSGPFFISKGPDGELGNINGNANAREQAEDNVYSFDRE
jgi:prepilin-type N-terminal cleavage/methylation domain-containing protein